MARTTQKLDELLEKYGKKVLWEQVVPHDEQGDKGTHSVIQYIAARRTVIVHTMYETVNGKKVMILWDVFLPCKGGIDVDKTLENLEKYLKS